MNAKALIYAPSAELDKLAVELSTELEAVRAEAKRLRWLEAPEWANCISKPTKAAVRSEEYRRRFYPQRQCGAADPHGEQDWRWANRDNFGWFHFVDCESPAEAGGWTVVEWRDAEL